MIRNIALVILGVFCSLALTEGALRLRWGAPRLNADKNFLWGYVDIYSPLYTMNAETGRYEPSPRLRGRPGESTSFPVKKAAQEKRIFVIGESVAMLFDRGMLERRFNEALPQYRWSVINCGMGGYDSYRTLLVAKEVLGYEPDLILLMMGNNEGCFRPVRINDWIYRFPLLSKSWITRIVTEYLNPPLRVPLQESSRYFQKHLNAIAAAAQRKQVPLMLCTLPSNRAINYGHSWTQPEEKDDFALWWLYATRPSEFIRKAESMDALRRDQLQFYLARAFGRSGKDREAGALYARNICPWVAERNRSIRELAASRPDSALLVEIDKLFDRLAAGRPGFDLFWDEMHYWPPVYEHIADEMITGVITWGRLPGCGPRAGIATARRPPDARAIAEQCRRMKEDARFFAAIDMHLLNTPDWEATVYPWVMRGWYDINSSMIVKTIHRKEQLLASVEKERERKWAFCLTTIGTLLLEEGRYPDAIAYFTEVLRNDPEDGRSRFFRGLARYALGRRQAAEEDLSSLRQSAPRYRWLTLEYLDSLGAPGKAGI